MLLDIEVRVCRVLAPVRGDELPEDRQGMRQGKLTMPAP
jgi:hypothetical protein